jgi:hypothetical protein
LNVRCVGGFNSVVASPSRARAGPFEFSLLVLAYVSPTGDDAVQVMSELVVLKVNSEERRNGVDGHVIGFLAFMLAQTEAKLAEMQG